MKLKQNINRRKIYILKKKTDKSPSEYKESDNDAEMPHVEESASESSASSKEEISSNQDKEDKDEEEDKTKHVTWHGNGRQGGRWIGKP